MKVFPFQSLPKFSRNEARLRKNLTTTIFPTPPNIPPKNILGDSWKKLLGGSFDLSSNNITVTDCDSTKKLYQNTTLTAVFRYGSLGHFCVVTDRVWALSVANRALCLNRDFPVLDEFTSAHEGALMMFFAQVAMRLFSPAHLATILTVTDDLDSALTRVNNPELIAWQWEVLLGNRQSFCTVLLPSQWFSTDQAKTVSQLDRFPGLDLDVSCSLLCMREQCSVRTLSKVQVGDIWTTDDALHWVTPEGLSGAGTIQQGSLIIPCRIHNEQITLTQPAQHRPTPRQPATSQDMSVEVEVVITEKSFSIAEMSRWQQGQVIHFPQPFTHPVTILVNGTPFAKASLCETNGVVGAEVLTLL